jgi:hypothetical protein
MNLSMNSTRKMQLGACLLRLRLSTLEPGRTILTYHYAELTADLSNGSSWNILLTIRKGLAWWLICLSSLFVVLTKILLVPLTTLAFSWPTLLDDDYWFYNRGLQAQAQAGEQIQVPVIKHKLPGSHSTLSDFLKPL